MELARDAEKEPLRFTQDALNKLFPHETISKHKINNLILNYFIQEGFQKAAFSFSKEARIDLDVHETAWTPSAHVKQFLSEDPGNAAPVDFVQAVRIYSETRTPTPETTDTTEIVKGYSSIDKRREIKYLILKGDITLAIYTISTYFPTVLDSNNLLLFKLLRLNLIEMIRSHKFQLHEDNLAAERKFLDDILTFVRDNLISKVTHSYDLLKELEISMSLLCFNFDPNSPVEELSDLPEELRHLFDLSLRNECYRVVNRAILDLEIADPTLHYKGPLFVEFNAESLQKLAGAPRLEEDVEMADTEEYDFHVEPAAPLEPALHHEEHAVTVSLESRLEKIAMLWIVTENRLVEKKITAEKRYGRLDDGTTLL